MTYTALAIVFMLVCVGAGARASWAAGHRPALVLAIAVVAAQFALLVTQ